MNTPIVLVDVPRRAVAVLTRSDLAAAMRAGVWPRHQALQGQTPFTRLKEMKCLAVKHKAVCLCGRAEWLADDATALAVALKLYDLITSGCVPADDEADALQDEFCAAGVLPFYCEGMPFRQVYKALIPAAFEPGILAKARTAAAKQKQTPALMVVVDLNG
mgnify:CR=1 FL=1